MKNRFIFNYKKKGTAILETVPSKVMRGRKIYILF